MKQLLCVLFVLAIASCASTYKTESVVDGSTEVTTNESITKIQSQLTKSERKKFMLALFAINLDGVGGFEFLAKTNGGNPQIDFSSLGLKINGLNYYQILELAEKSSTRVSLQ